MTEENSLADPVGELAEEFMARRRRGERPTVSEYADNRPELADRIRDVFAMMLMMEQADSSSDSFHSATSDRSGDGERPDRIAGYRILREVGRGGMGVVFEAEQLSLGRHVALKVLPRSISQDPRGLERFRREARAAARLHHTNIVPVHEVGQDGGTLYYAMQFIQGQPLDLVLDELKVLRHQHERREEPAPMASATAAVARSLLTGTASQAGSPTETVMGSTDSTERVTRVTRNPSSAVLPGQTTHAGVEKRQRHYDRSVAQVGLQVAEALAYSHREGIVHRDIKPSNLLLDADSRVWITDFGLAKSDGDALTHTGDIVGTIRYMAPERFRGWSDPRSDVYSLGLTLYEMLLLRPAFEANDRLELIRQVIHDEPIPPRKADPTIPRDLETIVLKTIDKEPSRRYGSSDELAADLRRFLEGEPIKARTVGSLERAWIWAKRRRAIAGLLVSLALVLVGGFLATSLLWVRAERARGEAEDQKRRAEAHNKEMRRQDYIDRIAMAMNEVRDDNVGRAVDLLQGCPVEFRGFEWDYANRLAHQELRTYWGHRRYLGTPRFGQTVQCLAISPDGSWIASGAGHPFGLARNTDRAEIRIWDPSTGRDRHQLTGLPGTVQSVAISPDGSRIAAGGGSYQPKVEGWLTVWDTAAMDRPLWTRHESGGTVMSVAFSPDGRSIVAGHGHSENKDVTGHARLWDVENGTERGEKFAALRGGVSSVSFHPDGRRVALAGFGHVEIWDLTTRALSIDLDGHVKWVFCVAFSRDGTRLATSGFDQTVKLWDPDTGVEVKTLYGHQSFVRGLAFAPDGGLLASVSDQNDVRLWDVATGREAAAFHGHAMFPHAVAFHPDGRRIASGGADGTVKIWDAMRSRPVVFLGHTGHIEHVAFRDDGRRVASETARNQYKTGNETLLVWNPLTGEQDPTPPGAVTIADLGPAFGPGGKRGDGRSEEGRKVTSRDGSRIAVISLLNPDSRFKEALGVHVLDAITGQVLTTLTGQGHTNSIWCVAFSPDGKRLATASGDQTIKIWDAADGRNLLTLRGHGHEVDCLAFSPDGRLLVSGGADTTVRVWDATPFSSDDLYEQEALRLVFPSGNQWAPLFKDELIDRLNADASLDAPVRAAALGLAEKSADDPQHLDWASWRTVQVPDGRLEDYRRALSRAETATRLDPENGLYVQTLGVASYRVGQYDKALEILNRSIALDAAKAVGPTPAAVAFLAMTHHRLGHGHAADARANLDVLRSRMKSPEAARDIRSQAFLHEAEALIDPRSTAINP